MIFRIISFLVIAAFNLICFFPSLFHAPRADQIAYLAEVADKNNWFELAIQSYDLTRTRLYNPGDEFLFRPLVYFILGTEKYFFGYHFFWWQAVGILLHLLVLWFLLKLLLKIQPGVFAVLLTAYFSVLPINIDLVIWHHMNGYLVFLIFILLILNQLYSFTRKEQPQNLPLSRMTLYLFLACFFFEAGMVYSFLIFFYLILTRSSHQPLRKGYFLALVPAFLYAGVSFLNFVSNKTTLTEGILKDFGLFKTLKDTFLIFGRFSYNQLFANQFFYLWWARPMMLLSTEKANILRVFDWGLVFIYGVVFFLGLNKKFLKDIGKFCCLLLAMILGYLFIVVVGRTNSRGLDHLQFNLYYNYIFGIFFVVFIYQLINFDRIRKFKFWSKVLKCGAAISLGVLILLNGFYAYRINQTYAQESRLTLNLVRHLEALIQDHGQEPNFSFYVEPEFPGNYEVPWLRKKGDLPLKRYSFIEAIYHPYFNRENPQFTFVAFPVGRDN